MESRSNSMQISFINRMYRFNWSQEVIICQLVYYIIEATHIHHITAK